MTLAGIVLENFCSGGRKCLFVTAGSGLFLDFKNTLRKLFHPGSTSKLHFFKLKDWIENAPGDDEIVPSDGKMHVVRINYRWLTEEKNMQMLEKWLGKDYTDLVRKFFYVIQV